MLVQLKDWKENWWKFPQGGVDEGETEEEAIKRELFEELNITSFKIIRKTAFINRYAGRRNFRKRKAQNGEVKIKDFM